MAVRKQDMERLIEQRDRLLREIEALRNKVAGIEMAMALLESDSSKNANSPQVTTRRGGTKGIVLDLLREVGTTGLNAATAVQIAERRGTRIDRGTVSSLLSRLKRDGIVAYDGDKYRLREFDPEPADPDSTEGAIEKRTLHVLDRSVA